MKTTFTKNNFDSPSSLPKPSEDLLHSRGIKTILMILMIIASIGIACYIINTSSN